MSERQEKKCIFHLMQHGNDRLTFYAGSSRSLKKIADRDEAESGN